MKKQIPFEKMLQDYCNVQPPYKFTVQMEEPMMNFRKIKIFTAVACALLVLVCAVAFTSFSGNKFTSNDAYDIPQENTAFMVKAYSQQNKDVKEILSSSAIKIDKDNPLIWLDGEDSSKNLAINHIALEITGKNIESYSLKAKNGVLHFWDDLHRLDNENVSEDGTCFDYFVSGKSLFDLPVNTEETFLFWLPDTDKINSVASDFEQKCELLKTAEDYNEYFGDTLTLTVEYGDGTVKTTEIHITFDSEGFAYANIS